MDDGLDIPEFLKLTRAQRKAAWRNFKPRPNPDVISMERWKQYEHQRRDEAKQKTQERIAAFRASRGMDPFYD